jgi:putative lipoprotein
VVRTVKVVGLAVVLGTVLSSLPARAADDDPWISRDKAFHFDVSLGLASAGYAVGAAWVVDARWKALALSGGATLLVGAGKELLDLAGLGDPSWKDMAWDAIGTVAGLALAWGVDLLLGGVDSARPALSAPHRASIPATMILRF